MRRSFVATVIRSREGSTRPGLQSLWKGISESLWAATIGLWASGLPGGWRRPTPTRVPTDEAEISNMTAPHRSGYIGFKDAP